MLWSLKFSWTLGLPGVLGRFLDGLLHRFLDDSLHRGLDDLVVEYFFSGPRHDLFHSLFYGCGERLKLVNENSDRLFRLFLRNRGGCFLFLRRLLPRGVRSAPIVLKRGHEFFHNLGFSDDESDFTPGIQFGGTQALAANEGLVTVANNGASVQAHSGQFLDFYSRAFADL